MNGMQWYVLYTSVNQEKKVANFLRRREIECFLPLMNVSKNWKKRKSTICEVPLFPGYVFIKIAGKQKHLIYDIPGVLRYVPNNVCPSIVNMQEIEVIRRITQEQDNISREPLGIGQLIEITDGPFQGFKGILYEKKGKTRLGVRVTSLGESLSVEIDLLSLRKITYSELSKC